MIDEAAKNKADVILLPEAMDLGWTDPSALTDALPIPEGKTCQFLMEMAKKHQVYICSGLIEKAECLHYEVWYIWINDLRGCQYQQ